EQLVQDGIEAAIIDKRERVRMKATRAGGPAEGPVAAPMARECSFTGFMKCGPTQFHKTKGAVGLVRWFEKIENTFEINECAKGKKVKFATVTLHGQALTWWNSQVATLGHEVAYGRPWIEVKQMMIDEFCPTKEFQRLEDELRHLKLIDRNIAAYMERFNELALLCLDAVPNEKKKVELYIKGLPEIIKGETTSSRPATLNEAVRKNNNNNSHNQGNYKNNNHHNQNNNQRQSNARALTTAQNEGANQSRIAPNVTVVEDVILINAPQSMKIVEEWDIRPRTAKARMWLQKADQRGGNMQGQAYVIRNAEHNQGPNVVTSTFLLNNRYATMLFDFGADKSFVDIKFSHLIDIKPVKLNLSYEVKLADEKVVSTNSVFGGCTLNLLNHLFDIDLMPIELDTFHVIVGMDWLVERDALIVCARKYIERGSQLFIAQVTEKEPVKKQLQDVPVICNFPEVFPDDLPGFPPPRQVKLKFVFTNVSFESFFIFLYDVIVISSNKVEGSGDWNSLEYQDTAAYNGEINLAFDENLILNEDEVKLFLDYEVKKGQKLVKKELIVSLKGELYFVKFIINLEEDDVEPRVILRRSFMRLDKGIVDFDSRVITIYLESDSFEDGYEKTEKSPDDWDRLLDSNFNDIPKFGEELPPLVCKIGKNNRNKKRSMENLSSFYQDIGPSLSAGDHLTQEEAAKEALAIRISQKFTLLEEVRPVIETMAYHDKYKKILDEIWKEKVE
nr:hypothetical protein [Tanacetum cinerariifolium]